MDLASHMLDFLDYVLGPIREARGYASNQANRYPAEDMVTGTFTFESGVQGAGIWCFAASDSLDRTEIVGSKGSISYSTFDTQPVVLVTDGNRTEFACDYPAHVQQPLIQTVVDTLNGQGSCPSTGESASRTSRVMDEMLRRSR